MVVFLSTDCESKGSFSGSGVVSGDGTEFDSIVNGIGFWKLRFGYE